MQQAVIWLAEARYPDWAAVCTTAYHASYVKESFPTSVRQEHDSLLSGHPYLCAETVIWQDAMGLAGAVGPDLPAGCSLTSGCT